MFTDVEVANVALAKLTKDPIVSLTENTDRAKMIRPVFPVVFRRFLTTYDWSFATRQIKLPQLSLAPDVSMPHENGFALPADFMKLQKVLPFFAKYRVMRYANNKTPALFTNEPAIAIRYTSSAALIGDFSPAAVDALSCLLAVELALNLENGTQRAELLIQRYQDAFAAARRDDIKSRNAEEMGGHDYTASRISAVSFGGV
jgi:hypothetical protein